MPVHADLGQFPRLQCRRCGLVALVDPDLPRDVRASLTCPLCTRPLLPPRLLTPGMAATVPPQVSGGASTVTRAGVERRRGSAPSRRRGPRQHPGPLPSSVAVSLALAGIAVLLVLVLFVWLLLTPHQSFWWALTR